MFAGRVDAAEGFFQRAVRVAPDHPGVLGNYAGFLQSYRKDYESAEHFYKESLLLKPDHVPSICSYSTIVIEQHKNLQVGRDMLARALELQPNIDAVRERLADVDRRMQQPEHAFMPS